MADLLTNRDFTQGFTTPFLDPIHGNVVRDNMRVPNGWDFWFAEFDYPKVDRQDTDWLAPEMTFRSKGDIPNTETLPETEWATLLENSKVVYHIFKGWGVQNWALSQTKTLQSGNYKFSINVFPDIYFRSGLDRNYQVELLAWEGRIVVDDVGSNWVNLSNVGNNSWSVLDGVFTVNSTKSVKIGIEVRCRWGIDVVGTFLKDAQLIKLDSTSPSNGSGYTTGTSNGNTDYDPGDLGGVSEETMLGRLLVGMANDIIIANYLLGRIKQRNK